MSNPIVDISTDFASDRTSNILSHCPSLDNIPFLTPFLYQINGCMQFSSNHLSITLGLQIPWHGLHNLFGFSYLLYSLTVYCLDFLTDYCLDFLTVYCLSSFFDSLLSGLSDSLLSGFPDKVYCLDYLTESTISMDYLKVYFLSGFSDKVDCLLGFPERGYHLDSLIVYCLFGFSGSLCLGSLTKSAVSFKYTHKRKIWMVVDDWLYKTQSQNMKDCTAVISLHQTNREITLKQIQ